MPYSTFTLKRVREALGLTVKETLDILPPIAPIALSDYLNVALTEGLEIVYSSPSEKARSEFTVTPLLVELRRLFDHKLNVFSGKEFNVDPALDLVGVCDYIVTRSDQRLEISAPVMLIVEAKKEDLNGGLGQCLAAMVAAQQVNQQEGNHKQTVYGCVTSGIAWKWLKLEAEPPQAVIGLKEYPLLPAEQILGILHWILEQ